MSDQRDDEVPLSPAETDVARGAWRRVRRHGVKYVDAGRLPDNSVELISTDGQALDEVADALLTPGTAVQRTQLPVPTKRDLAGVFDRAGERPPEIGAGPDVREESGWGTVALVAGGLVGLGLLLKAFSRGGAEDEDEARQLANARRRELRARRAELPEEDE
jgi:hypothetical protein